METLTINRKQDLLERAARLHKTGVFLPPDARNYVQAFLHQPFGFKDYQSAKEPVVDPRELYDLGEVAWLTVNSYNALVLNTSNMMIADIDFGDERINHHAGARDCDDVLTNLDELETLDENWFGFPDPDDDDKHDFRFAFQTYRVYRTHSGCRVICTSATMPWEDKGWLRPTVRDDVGGFQGGNGIIAGDGTATTVGDDQLVAEVRLPTTFNNLT